MGFTFLTPNACDALQETAILVEDAHPYRAIHNTAGTEKAGPVVQQAHGDLCRGEGAGSGVRAVADFEYAVKIEVVSVAEAGEHVGGAGIRLVKKANHDARRRALDNPADRNSVDMDLGDGGALVMVMLGLAMVKAPWGSDTRSTTLTLLGPSSPTTNSSAC